MRVVEIRHERNRQDRMWGGKSHDRNHLDDDWINFIYVRLVELGMHNAGELSYERRRELYLHIAALAVAAIEAQE